MKKKGISLLLALLFLFSLAACGQEEGQESSETQSGGETTEAEETTGTEETTEVGETTETGEEAGAATDGNILIAYFSWADNAVSGEEVDAQASPSVTEPGHVAQLATWVQEETGGDLFSIQVQEPYPTDWSECLDRGNQEKTDDVHPELAETLDNIDEYDVVFLGYPNWWYSCPMALFSFFDQHDLAGKQVYLFCSHGTGGLAESVEDISEALPDSQISDQVFDVYEEDAPSAQEDIRDWLDSLGY